MHALAVNKNLQFHNPLNLKDIESSLNSPNVTDVTDIFCQ